VYDTIVVSAKFLLYIAIILRQVSQQTTTKFSRDGPWPCTPSAFIQSWSTVPRQPTGAAARPDAGSEGSIELGLLSVEYFGSVNREGRGHKRCMRLIGTIFVRMSVWILV